MFDEIAANAGIIFALLVVMWIAQFGLTYWQINSSVVPLLSVAWYNNH